MEITLIKSLTIDGKKIEKLNLNLEDLTGEDVLKVDLELRAEGHPRGMDDVFNQNVLLKFASKASGTMEDDLKRLSLPDFLEVTFSVRNFLLGLSENQEEQENSEESSSKSVH
ncbi:hypothetical protein B4102_0229 [Heyndrickxia sporothermodurans]|uniref:Phage tail assembly protein n=1 Tax=Heyndrickxia sporothermodurans TaxID=46224 RepID=A0A150KSM3_9BACI|nr:hypothetical protein [Heyndrickxia sporothermodurans]KYD02635.1 hypothetical protein B4102_0229 [Heyndrickxia sporothermodurans]